MHTWRKQYSAGGLLNTVMKINCDTRVELLTILGILIRIVPPRIQRSKSGEIVEVRKGEPVTLDCSASGNPTPNITWARKNDVLPQGEKYFTGSSYPIKQTTRHDSGVYICTANNGVQPPASEQINLKVNYAPEIQVEKNWVHSRENAEAELVCIVNAEPAAEVVVFALGEGGICEVLRN
ncbi:hypothetical protein V9T40_004275 [Parthenolecanium corni]|uniref:Ig-like domain-containing protein n=1 Tax=Parthenolecanium corni TaxID=536013 RepID=A0AAN9TUL7_9HEMI